MLNEHLFVNDLQEIAPVDRQRRDAVALRPFVQLCDLGPHGGARIAHHDDDEGTPVDGREVDALVKITRRHRVVGQERYGHLFLAPHPKGKRETRHDADVGGDVSGGTDEAP